jgi:DNA-binding transcriptional LysR family regulator
VVANNKDPSAALSELAVFAAVAEAEGFSAAARRLGLSKSMVSTAVTRLEQRLGVRLLQRTTRRMSLTEAGHAALPHAQRVLLAARDAEEAATQCNLSPRGVLRVNAPMSFGLLHVMPSLGAFARINPEVQVDIVLDDRVLDLTEGGFDLAVRVGNLQDSALVAHPLGISRNILVAHHDYLALRGAPRAPSDLTAHATLNYSLASSGLRWTLTREGRSETVRIRPTLQANNSLALREALLQRLGIARIPLFVVGQDLAEGRLTQVLSEWELPSQGIYALTTSRDHLPRKTRAFIDFFREHLGTPAYWEPVAVRDSKGPTHGTRPESSRAGRGRRK